MQKTAVQQKTDLAARRVARRVFGDLLSIHEKFDMSTEGELAELAHDVQVGLAHDCIERLTLSLYSKGAAHPRRIYIYTRTEPGTFAESAHSGRIARDASLIGGRLDYLVSLRDRPMWEQLKQAGKLRIAWSPASAPSTAGMTQHDDGGYASGTIGLSRTCLVRTVA